MTSFKIECRAIYLIVVNTGCVFHIVCLRLKICFCVLKSIFLKGMSESSSPSKDEHLTPNIDKVMAMNAIQNNHHISRFRSIYWKIIKQVCTILVVVWPPNWPADQGSKPGGVLTQVETLCLCPHTTVGSQLEVQYPQVLGQGLWTVRVVRSVINSSFPTNTSFPACWRPICS